MRLLIVALVFVALVIVDQFKFRGYYGSQLSQYIVRVVQSATWSPPALVRASPGR